MVRPYRNDPALSDQENALARSDYDSLHFPDRPKLPDRWRHETPDDYIRVKIRQIETSGWDDKLIAENIDNAIDLGRWAFGERFTSAHVDQLNMYRPPKGETN